MRFFGADGNDGFVDGTPWEDEWEFAGLKRESFIVSDHKLYAVDASDRNVTAHVPEPSEGMAFQIKKVDSSSNALKFELPEDVMVDNGSAPTITGEGIALSFWGDGDGNYYIF